MTHSSTNRTDGLSSAGNGPTTMTCKYKDSAVGKSVSIGQCSFCTDRGNDIFVEIDEVLRHFENRNGNLDMLIHQEPEQRIFVSAVNGKIPGNCKHLLALHGNIALDTRRQRCRLPRNSGASFDWWHSCFNEAESGEAFSEFLRNDVVERSAPDRFLPQTPIVHRDFDITLRCMSLDESREYELSLVGDLLFTANVHNLYEEALVLNAEYGQWLENQQRDCLNVSYEEVETKKASRKIPRRNRR